MAHAAKPQDVLMLDVAWQTGCKLEAHDCVGFVEKSQARRCHERVVGSRQVLALAEIDINQSAESAMPAPPRSHPSVHRGN